MKAIIKLIIVVLMLNALWRVGSAYASYYRFKDSIRAAAIAEEKSDVVLRQKIVELASTYDVAVSEEDIFIRRDQHHTYVDSAYKTPVAVLPWYVYDWPFNVNVDAFVITPSPELRELVKP